MRKLEKEEGREDDCPICHEPIICQMTTYTSFPNKLQWQNEDGKSHYVYDKETKTTSCRGADESTDNKDVVANFQSSNVEWTGATNNMQTMEQNNTVKATVEQSERFGVIHSIEDVWYKLEQNEKHWIEVHNLLEAIYNKLPSDLKTASEIQDIENIEEED